MSALPIPDIPTSSISDRRLPDAAKAKEQKHPRLPLAANRPVRNLRINLPDGHDLGLAGPTMLALSKGLHSDLRVSKRSEHHHIRHKACEERSRR